MSIAAPNINAIKAWKARRHSELPNSIAMHVIHLLEYKNILSYNNCFEALPSIQSIDNDVWSKRVASSDPSCVSVNQDKEVQNSIFNMMANSFIIAQSQTLLQSRGARLLA